MKRVVYGDIGGTKTLLTLAAVTEEGERVLAQQRYTSNEHASFEHVLDAFYTHAGIAGEGIEGACFAVAGPVSHDSDGDRSKVTNLPWHLDSTPLEQRFDIQNVRIVNDFEAVGYGIPALDQHDLCVLQSGVEHERATRLALGAGTGLGLAFMIWCEDHYRVLPTEAGHADFSPANAQQCELYRFLAHEFGRVSCEHVLSGPGVVNIYRFLHHVGGHDDAALKAILASDDPSAAIAAQADAGDPLADEAMNLFVDIYGGQAGNVALTIMARGGVYIAGGIAPKILHRLEAGRFMNHFLDKGKMADLMPEFPVSVVLNSNVGLIGARETAKHTLTD